MPKAHTPIVGYAIYRHDGTLCEPIERTKEGAEHCAALYAKNSGAPSPYIIEPLVRLRDVHSISKQLTDA